MFFVLALDDLSGCAAPLRQTFYFGMAAQKTVAKTGGP
jgi:hypothetical protein